MPSAELRETMSTLRAVRRLRADPIPDDGVERALEAACWAPTGGNQQPWRIVLVRSAEKKAVLGELYAGRWASFAGHYQQRLEGLPEDQRSREQRTLAAGDYLAEHFADTPVIAVFCFDPGQMAITDAKLERVSVVGGASVYTAVQNLLLAARAEGLGCVLTTLLCMDEERVKALLDIPEAWGTAAAIPLGYPVGSGHGPIRRAPPAKLVYEDSFGTGYQGGTAS